MRRNILRRGSIAIMAVLSLTACTSAPGERIFQGMEDRHGQVSMQQEEILWDGAVQICLASIPALVNRAETLGMKGDTVDGYVLPSLWNNIVDGRTISGDQASSLIELAITELCPEYGHLLTDDVT